MEQAIRPFFLLGLAAAVLAAVMAVKQWRSYRSSEALLFFGMLLALCGWSLTSGIQYLFDTAPAQILFQRVGFVLGGTIPTFWFLFTLEYADYDRWLSRRLKAVFLSIPALYALLVFTNGFHTLVVDEARLTVTAYGPAVYNVFDWGYYLFAGYSYLVILVGMVVLFRVFVRNPTLYGTQSALLAAGTLPPTLAHVAFTLGLSWGPLPEIDLTPFALLFTTVCFGVALFWYDLLERTQIARENMLQEMGDGLIVLDGDGELVDTNAIADQIIESNPELLAEIADGDRDTLQERILSTLDGRTVTATVDNESQVYDLECSNLSDSSGNEVGYVVALRNVTERNRYEERLEVAQRVLRHNLRNDMNVISGFASQLDHDGEDGEAARRIIERSETLLETSEKLRRMTHIDTRSETGDRRSVDMREDLLGIVETVGANHPDATLECEIPGAVGVSLSDEQLFTIPVRNVLQNAIEHNPAATPWARLTGKQVDGQFEIRIEDDGPEIPEAERGPLEEGTETPLEHGSGIGLWLTQWSMATAGGSIEFTPREPNGNVVTLRFPAGDG